MVIRTQRCRKTAPVAGRVKPATVTIESLDKYIQSWVLDCKSGRCSATYLDNVRLVSGKLLWWLRREGRRSFDSDAIRHFFIYLQTAHELPEGRWGEVGEVRGDKTGRRVADSVRYRAVAARTVADYRRHITTLCNWMVAQQYISESPMASVRAIIDREGVHDFRVFSREDIRRVLLAAKQKQGNSIRNLRDYAICLLLLDTGLRATELCDLTWSKMDFDQRRATISGKGDKRRTVYWSADTNRALWAYLNASMPCEDLAGSVFVAESGGNIGQGITRHGLRSILADVGERAGVAGVHPHAFRHTFAVLFLLSGGDSRALQDLMGHTSPRMTARYVRFSGADLQEKAREFSPVAFVMRRGNK